MDPGEKMRLWIDTDVGSDVDDALAIAYALRHPALELVGVSTVFGDVALRGRIASRLLALGGSVADSAVESRMSAVDAGSCATLIYTSGTTGNPKAVMISHDNIIYESVSAMLTLFEGARLTKIPKELRIVSYLPLSHVAAQASTAHA